MSRPVGAPPVDYAALVEDFDDTRPYHRGLLSLAAHRLGLEPTCLEKRLRVARSRGLDVQFEDDLKGWGL